MLANATQAGAGSGPHPPAAGISEVRPDDADVLAAALSSDEATRHEAVDDPGETAGRQHRALSQLVSMVASPSNELADDTALIQR